MYISRSLSNKLLHVQFLFIFFSNCRHINEHLKEQINVNQDKPMSNEDLQFHYFKVHDSDNDDKLDGIELATAMAHYHEEENGEKPEDYTEEVRNSFCHVSFVLI